LNDNERVFVGVKALMSAAGEIIPTGSTGTWRGGPDLAMASPHRLDNDYIQKGSY